MAVSFIQSTDVGVARVTVKVIITLFKNMLYWKISAFSLYELHIKLKGLGINTDISCVILKKIYISSPLANNLTYEYADVKFETDNLWPWLELFNNGGAFACGNELKNQQVHILWDLNFLTVGSKMLRW